MEYSNNHVITITSEEDIDNYMKEHKDLILEILQNSTKDKDFIEFEDYTTEELHIKKINKGINEYFNKHGQFSFLLKTGLVISGIYEGKLVTILPTEL